MCALPVLKALMVLCFTVFASAYMDKPYINTLHVTTDIKFHFATTLVTSIMHNPLASSSEAVFDITLPNAAFISNFTLEIDDKIYPASVKEKEAAKKEYERAKNKGQSAGHVASRPRETNKFRIQVNVAGESVVVFNLTYQEVLQRKIGAYESVIYLDPGQVVEDLKVQVFILENRPLKFLHVLPLKGELLASVDITGQNQLAIVDRPSPKHGYVLYQPSAAQQRQRSLDGISALFTVRYDVERDYDAGDLLVVNGYFVHFIAPVIPEHIPKEIVFILDKSGSMSGTKIGQLKAAMRVILADLQEGDRFNIVMFSNVLTTWRNGLVPVTKKNIKQALHFVGNVHASGYTNINLALLQGLNISSRNNNKTSQPIVMFLSDGQATSGEILPDKILLSAKMKNEDGVPIYSLAFGSDADWNLSKQLSFQSEAVARRIYEDADADIQMTNFYQEVSTTLLTGVKVKYLEDQVKPGSLTTSEFKTFFNGSEIIVAGRLSDTAHTLTVGVKAMSILGPVNLQVENDLSDLPPPSSITSLSDIQDITEKMWAYLTIKQMLKEMDETIDANVKAELKAKAIELSLKYSFVTPLTSMIVTKPDEDSRADLSQGDEEVAVEEDTDLNQSSSYAGGDPHFMISIKSMAYPLCFDVKGQAGNFYRLLNDPVYDLTVNTNMQEDITFSKDGRLRVLMTKMIIRYKDLTVFVSTNVIIVGDQQLHWGTDGQLDLQGSSVTVNGLSLTVDLDFGVQVLLSKTIKHTEVPARLDFLNVEIENEDRLSPSTIGVLGQFAHKCIRMKEIETPFRRVLAHLWIAKDEKIIATGSGFKRSRNNFVLHRNKTCIEVNVPTQLFEVNPQSFFIPHLNYT